MLSHKEADDVARTAVVGSVEVALLLRQLMVAAFEIGKPPLVESSYGLCKITERICIGKVEHFGVVVLDDPRKDRVLSEVERAPLRVGVQYLQVLKVGDRALGPLVGVDLDVGLLCLASAREVLLHALVDLITLLLILEAE